MENLQFLDTTGLEEDEIRTLQSCLVKNSKNVSLPWIFKKEKFKEKRCKDAKEVKCNGSSTLQCCGISNNMDYGHHMPYVGVAYNQTQVPTYGPVHYQHPPIYTSYHHPGQMMNSATNSVHFVYTSSQIYNYAQVPVAYQTYSRNSQYYSAAVHGQAVRDFNYYNGVSNGEITFYDQTQIKPQESAVINDIPVKKLDNVEVPAKLEISVEKSDDQKDICETGILKISAPAGNKNKVKGVKSVKKKNKISPTKTETKESRNVNLDAARKNKSGSTSSEEEIVRSSESPQKEKVNNTENIDAEVTTTPEIKTSPIPPFVEENPSVKQNAINISSESVWNKKPGALLFKDAPKTNGSQVREILEIEPGTNRKQNTSIYSSSYRLGEYLVNYKIDGKAANLQPRGLINKSNYCYINAILQALLACSPLCNLLKGLSENLSSSGHDQSIPMIETMCQFMKEFSNLSDTPEFFTSKKNRKRGSFDVNCGSPIEAVSFYKMLNGTRSDSFLVEGRQEDAEEFLGLLLNGLNDEMMNAMKTIREEDKKNSFITEVNEDSDDWKVMGPKKKSNITRKVQFDKTPISDIFGGLLCSKIHKTGDESTVNIQPFLTLQLNIEKADTISEALELLTVKNRVEGLTSSKTKQTVDAWQQVMIEQLPVVLILHLKCFNYSYEGCTKIIKSVDFPIDLQIDSKILTGKPSSLSEKQYKLFSVVYHEGKEAIKGHYVADVYHKGYNTWLRFDDAKVKSVLESDVLNPQGYKVPYLLFYKRTD